MDKKQSQQESNTSGFVIDITHNAVEGLAKRILWEAKFKGQPPLVESRGWGKLNSVPWFSPVQIKAVVKALQCFSSGNSGALMSIPPGFGKTAIALLLISIVIRNTGLIESHEQLKRHMEPFVDPKNLRANLLAPQLKGLLEIRTLLDNFYAEQERKVIYSYSPTSRRPALFVTTNSLLFQTYEEVQKLFPHLNTCLVRTSDMKSTSFGQGDVQLYIMTCDTLKSSYRRFLIDDIVIQFSQFGLFDEDYLQWLENQRHSQLFRIAEIFERDLERDKDDNDNSDRQQRQQQHYDPLNIDLERLARILSNAKRKMSTEFVKRLIYLRSVTKKKNKEDQVLVTEDRIETGLVLCQHYEMYGAFPPFVMKYASIMSNVNRHNKTSLEGIDGTTQQPFRVLFWSSTQFAVTVFDEVDFARSSKSFVNRAVRAITTQSNFVYGMSATPIHDGVNNLINIFCCLGIRFVCKTKELLVQKLRESKNEDFARLVESDSETGEIDLLSSRYVALMSWMLLSYIGNQKIDSCSHEIVRQFIETKMEQVFFRKSTSEIVAALRKESPKYSQFYRNWQEQKALLYQQTRPKFQFVRVPHWNDALYSACRIVHSRIKNADNYIFGDSGSQGSVMQLLELNIYPQLVWFSSIATLFRMKKLQEAVESYILQRIKSFHTAGSRPSGVSRTLLTSGSNSSSSSSNTLSTKPLLEKKKQPQQNASVDALEPKQSAASVILKHHTHAKKTQPVPVPKQASSSKSDKQHKSTAGSIDETLLDPLPVFSQFASIIEEFFESHKLRPKPTPSGAIDQTTDDLAQLKTSILSVLPDMRLMPRISPFGIAMMDICMKHLKIDPNAKFICIVPYYSSIVAALDAFIEVERWRGGDRKILQLVGLFEHETREEMLSSAASPDVGYIVAVDKLASHGVNLPHFNVMIFQPGYDPFNDVQIAGRIRPYSTQKSNGSYVYRVVMLPSIGSHVMLCQQKKLAQIIEIFGRKRKNAQQQQQQNDGENNDSEYDMNEMHQAILTSTANIHGVQRYLKIYVKRETAPPVDSEFKEVRMAYRTCMQRPHLDDSEVLVAKNRSARLILSHWAEKITPAIKSSNDEEMVLMSVDSFN